MSGSLEFWFEFASTYSYPAAIRVEELARDRDVEIVWKPFLLGPIFQDLGWKTSPFNLQPAKGAYMWRDLQRTCAQLGAPFTRPAVFPQNGLLAARVALALPDNPARGAFARGVYSRQFAQAQDISDPAQITAVLEDIGQAAEAVLDRATSPAIKEALKHETALAREHGIFGAPTWRTSDGELFWGNDRLEDALDWQRGVG